MFEGRCAERAESRGYHRLGAGLVRLGQTTAHGEPVHAGQHGHSFRGLGHGGPGGGRVRHAHRRRQDAHHEPAATQGRPRQQRTNLQGLPGLPPPSNNNHRPKIHQKNNLFKFFKSLFKTVKNEGFLALYKGFAPSYIRLAPWNIIVTQQTNKYTPN